MKNYEIIKFFANSKECEHMWKPYRRYFKILENYLQGKTLSIIEKRNYKHNPPRKFYLDELVKAFSLDIDYASPLFEGRINETFGYMFYSSKSFAIPRFLRRLDEARRANIEINETVLKDLMMMGDKIFPHVYPQCISIDP